MKSLIEHQYRTLLRAVTFRLWWPKPREKGTRIGLKLCVDLHDGLRAIVHLPVELKGHDASAGWEELRYPLRSADPRNGATKRVTTRSFEIQQINPG